jgi:hypothetical protein
MSFRKIVVAIVAVTLLAPVVCAAGKAKELPTDAKKLPKLRRWAKRGIEAELKTYGPVKDTPKTLAMEVAVKGDGFVYYLLPFETEIVPGKSYTICYKAKASGIPVGSKVQLGYLGQYFPDRKSYKDSSLVRFIKEVKGSNEAWIEIKQTETYESLLGRLKKRPSDEELAKAKLAIGSILISFNGKFPDESVSVTIQNATMTITEQKKE